MGNVAEILAQVKIMFDEHPVAAWTMVIGAIVVCFVGALGRYDWPAILAMLNAIGLIGK